MQNTPPEAAEYIGRLEDAEEAHELDLRLIAQRLHQEAEDHNWCSEYDEMIEQINGGLWKKIPPRVHKWIITAEYPVRVQRVVEAATHHEARRQVANEWLEQPTVMGIDGWIVVGKGPVADHQNMTAELA